jgi:hypothetical protein
VIVFCSSVNFAKFIVDKLQDIAMEIRGNAEDKQNRKNRVEVRSRSNLFFLTRGS